MLNVVGAEIRISRKAKATRMTMFQRFRETYEGNSVESCKKTAERATRTRPSHENMKVHDCPISDGRLFEMSDGIRLVSVFFVGASLDH